MFAIYRETPHRTIWPLVLVFAGLIVAVIVALSTGNRQTYAVETRRGVQRLQTGMGASKVERMLGHPIAIENQNGLECRRYGHLTFDQKFWIYSVCYDAGRLVSLKAGQFEAKRLENIPRMAPTEPEGAGNAVPETTAPPAQTPTAPAPSDATSTVQSKNR